MFDDNKKIGVGLCALGIFVGGTGCVLFFDRALLALANVSEPDEIPVTPQTCLAQLAFLTGIGFLLGLTKTIKFFFKPDKIAGKASRRPASYLLGIHRLLSPFQVQFSSLEVLLSSFGAGLLLVRLCVVVVPRFIVCLGC